MKYKLELEIAAPRKEVAGLFDDPEHWPQWQESLVESEPISGKNREVGSKTKLLQKFGSRNVEVETIIEAKNPPEELVYTYTAKGAWNRVVNRFEEIGPDRTRWIFESEFNCSGMLRVLSILMPSMFRNASRKEMKKFKEFVEKRSASG